MGLQQTGCERKPLDARSPLQLLYNRAPKPNYSVTQGRLGLGQYHNDAKDLVIFSDMNVFSSLSQLPILLTVSSKLILPLVRKV